MTKVCKKCGCNFETKSNRKQYCPECAQMISKECEEKIRSKKIMRKYHEASHLDETLKALSDYNAAHGTNLSYGQYKHMLFIQQLKNK